MINITLHFHTKKALFSRDIAFQQSLIKGFRDRRIGINRRILEIMETFCYFRNIVRVHERTEHHVGYRGTRQISDFEFDILILFSII